MSAEPGQSGRVSGHARVPLVPISARFLPCSKSGKKSGASTEFKKQSIKYSAQRLYEKGVVLEIEGLPKHQYVSRGSGHMWAWLMLIYFLYRFRNASIELTAIEPGVFEVTGRVMGVAMDKVELVFQVCVVTMATDTSLILWLFCVCRICYSCSMRACQL